MFKLLLGFAAGYYFGKGGSVAALKSAASSVGVNSDGTLVISGGQPQSDPGTVPVASGTGNRYSIPDAIASAAGYPLGSSIDTSGNVYGPLPTAQPLGGSVDVLSAVVKWYSTPPATPRPAMAGFYAGIVDFINPNNSIPITPSTNLRWNPGAPQLRRR